MMHSIIIANHNMKSQLNQAVGMSGLFPTYIASSIFSSLNRYAVAGGYKSSHAILSLH